MKIKFIVELIICVILFSACTSEKETNEDLQIDKKVTEVISGILGGGISDKSEEPSTGLEGIDIIREEENDISKGNTVMSESIPMGQEEQTEEHSKKETDGILENDFHYYFEEDGRLLFSTEYEIEDYCHGCFIVSKNDGLLYGMLDKDGNEIIPLRYDSISFMNEEAINQGRDSNLYIKTRYEDRYTVVDEKGNQILDKNAAYADYKLGSKEEDSYCFVFNNKMSNGLWFYDKNGTFLFETNYSSFGDEKLVEAIYTDYVKPNCEWISKDYFLVRLGGVVAGDGGNLEAYWNVAIYSIDNQILQQWDKVVTLTGGRTIDDKYVFILSDYMDNQVIYTIDRDGNICGDWERNLIYGYSYPKGIFKWEEYGVKEDIEGWEYYLGKDKDIELYQSNSTWKLEYNGKPLYYERYYKCAREGGCYFLSNENDQVCLVDSNGNMIVDYGWLTWQNRAPYFMDKEIHSGRNFFIGDDGLCFVQKGDVYFFSRPKDREIKEFNTIVEQAVSSDDEWTSYIITINNDSNRDVSCWSVMLEIGEDFNIDDVVYLNGLNYTRGIDEVSLNYQKQGEYLIITPKGYNLENDEIKTVGEKGDNSYADIEIGMERKLFLLLKNKELNLNISQIYNSELDIYEYIKENCPQYKYVLDDGSIREGFTEIELYSTSSGKTE